MYSFLWDIFISINKNSNNETVVSCNIHFKKDKKSTKMWKYTHLQLSEKYAHIAFRSYKLYSYLILT